MLKKLLNITVLSLAIFHVQLSAVEVTKLDQADIIVDSRANSARSAALKQALASVFLKKLWQP
ncbi:DUF2066 domain-containing protein [Shewanella sp. HL-SH8]|uniref:DUF2066 domain-containing protein n=1 Tax=Shewanella sp. HL-SH8 TaxID=3436242 RepID=UPI003EB6FF13